MTKIYSFAIAVVMALGVGACREPAAPVEATEVQAARAPDPAPVPTFEQNAICPRAWTCNHVSWYGTEAACKASCGPVCELDYRCGAGCTCP